MRNPRAVLIAIGIVLVLVVLASSFYTVPEWEQVVITKFGRPVGGVVASAGLKFKLPFVEKVNRFDRRILEWDGQKREIPTADKRFIWIDTTARWKIADPVRFLQAVITIEVAQRRLGNVLEAATRNEISSHNLAEVVRNSNRVLDVIKKEAAEALSSRDAQGAEQGGEQAGEEWRFAPIETGREAIAAKILARAREEAGKFGIVLIDVRIKRINYVETVRRKVYDRMSSERHRIAERFRSEGSGRAQEILGRKERDEKQISSSAQREAEEIKAKAELEAAKIYNEAFGADPEFYHFWRSLQAYQKIIGANHTLVISPEADLYRYLFSMQPGG